MALVPQPVKAFILCFPITDELKAAQKEQDDKIAKDGQHALDPRLVFMKQTVSTPRLIHRFTPSLTKNDKDPQRLWNYGTAPRDWQCKPVLSISHRYFFDRSNFIL